MFRCHELLFCRPSRLGCIFVALFLIGTMPAAAQTTIHVPAEQATIQAAIDAGSNGDTVLVAPGTYYENIDFKGKAITVTSEGGAAVTTIDGGAKDSVVMIYNVTAGTPVISGFTITNGYGKFAAPNWGDGSGVFVLNASPNILNNVITRNKSCSDPGIGVYVSQGAAIIQGNTITENQSVSCSGGIGGGGIALGAANGTQIVGNVISNNHHDNSVGGGISLWGSGSVVIRANIISGNTAHNWGGGIVVVNGSSPQIIGNLIVGNKADEGGGVYWSLPDGQPELLLLGNTIAGNDGAAGSGVFAEGYDKNAKILNNLIIGKQGQSAIYCGNSNDTNNPTIQYNDVYSNGASAYSGICGNLTGTSGNVSFDPLFVAPDVSNYHLQPGSPVIDVGNNSFTGIPATDLAGWQRIYDGNSDGTATIDLGAFEYAGKTSSSLSTQSVTFSAQKVGLASNIIRVTLTNTGAHTLDVSAITVAGDFLQGNTCRVNNGVTAGRSCTIDLRFAPKSRGTQSGTVSIVSNADTSPQTITLQGTGTAPIATLTPTSLTFGDQMLSTTSAAQVVTITNTGDADLVVASVTATGDFAVSNGCAVVAPAGSCGISVTFTPKATRTRTGAITIVDDATGSPRTVTLSGNGIGPEIAFSPTSMSFPPQRVGTTSNPLTLTITNTGTGALLLVGISITGDYSQTNSCPRKLAVGTGCQVTVSFKPTRYGSRPGALSFSDDAAGSPQSVLLSGTGTEPLASVSPSSVAFSGSTLVGTTSPGYTVIYSNTGNEPIQISSITASAEFSQANTCGSVLAVNSYCGISVKFTPAAAGLRTGALQIVDNTAASPRSIPLTGTAISTYPVPALTSVAPGLVKVGSSASLNVSGSAFFPTSVIYWGEQPLATSYSSPTSLSATVPASLITDHGEYKVTVRTPAPGGGISNVVRIGAYRGVSASARDMVYDANRKSFYVSTPTAVLSVNPVNGAISTLATLSDANRLALSDDAAFLYVGLDATGEVARVSLPSGKVDFRVQLGMSSYGTPLYAQALKVLPGKPHAYVVSLAQKNISPRSFALVVYDDQVRRPATVSRDARPYPNYPNSLLFLGDAGILYGSDTEVSDFSFYRYSIDQTGITLTDTVPGAGGGNLASDGTSLYETANFYNQCCNVVDPSVPSLKTTYTPSSPGITAIKPDSAGNRLYSTSDNYYLYAAELSSLQTPASMALPITSRVTNIERWGTNGLALNAGQSGIMLMRTSLTGVSADYAPLSAALVSPTGGTGNATFSFQFSDPWGYSDLNFVQAIINSSGAYGGGCAFMYVPGTGRISLMNDNGTTWIGSAVGGTSTTLSNSHCTIDVSEVSVSGAGNQLILNMPISFASTFAGEKNVYGFAANGAGNSGWQKMGTWTPNTPAVVPVATAPTVNRGGYDSTTRGMTFEFSSVNGFGYIDWVQGIINTSASYASGCAFYFVPGQNLLYLMNDAGTAWMGPVYLGSQGVISNTQCSINPAKSLAQGEENTLILVLSLGESASVSGTQSIYGYAKDRGGLNSGWVQTGMWLPNPPLVDTPPRVVSAASTPGRMSFTFASDNGGSYIGWAQAIVGPTASYANSCTVYYQRAAKRLYLSNDAGTGWLGPVYLGQSTSVANSQCTIFGNSSSETVTGNNLTVNVSATYATGFTGVRNAWGYVVDNVGKKSNWVNMGPFTVQ